MRGIDVKKTEIKIYIAMIILVAILDCTNIVPIVYSAPIILLIMLIFNIVKAFKSNRTEKYLYIALNILMIIVLGVGIIGFI